MGNKIKRKMLRRHRQIEKLPIVFIPKDSKFNTPDGLKVEKVVLVENTHFYNRIHNIIEDTGGPASEYRIILPAGQA